MIGETTGGELIAGHSTAAAFEPDGTDATVEATCVDLLGQQS
jgi:hypothetical protein